MSQTRSYAIDFASFIQERTAGFTGRNWVFAAIDAWLGRDDVSRFFLLTGEPGSGKTAVAARLAQFSTGLANPPAGSTRLGQGFLSAFHFCRAAASDWTDPRTFARSISLQLAAIPEFAAALKDIGDTHINVDVKIETGAVASGAAVTGVLIQNLTIRGLNGQEAFNRTVLDPLRTIRNEGFDRPILILVDSLDEALASATEIKIVDLLAGIQGLDNQVRCILTSRTDPRVESRFLSADRLSLSDPANANANNLDISDFVTQQIGKNPGLASKVAALGPAQVATLPAQITARADGNFIYVAFLLAAAAAGQLALDNPAGLPAGLDGLYHDSLARVLRLGNKDWTTVYKPFLGVLSVAQEALTLNQVQIYAALSVDPWDVLVDLNQFIESTPGTLPAAPGEEVEDGYRLYHQSVADFLRRRQLRVSIQGRSQTVPNIYSVAPEDWHRRIVAHYRGKDGDWANVAWNKVDAYGLRYLVAHLYRLRDDEGSRASLHRLVQTQSFTDERLQGLANPNLALDDLRLALNMALEADELALIWQHILEYRRVIRQQLDFGRLQAAVAKGSYTAAEERTSLYGYLPNSQALARLLVAWNAAAAGQADAALAMTQRAVDKVPPRGVVRPALQRVEAATGLAVEDVLGEALQRLLVRISQAAAPTPGAQATWLRDAIGAWPDNAVEVAVRRLSEPSDSWGAFVDAEHLNASVEQLFTELGMRGPRLEGDMPPTAKQSLYFFQRRLAAGLFNSRQQPQWLVDVQRSVALIAVDDYPSYREMALSWIAAAVLAQEDEALARKALAVVLGGLFRPSPGFWGDTVAAAIDGMEREGNPSPYADTLLSLLEHLEATGEQGVDRTVDRKLPVIVEGRIRDGLPVDPWSFGMRRRNAVAAVLHRRGDLPAAEALLNEAAAEDYWGSYAGFRALARLSLACRWLEWRRMPDAARQIEFAGYDANNVRDPVLREERLGLVGKMQDWITRLGPHPETLEEADALAQLQHTSGMERGIYVEFLSALWCDDAGRLKRLLPFALDDATTADAVLGRLLGVAADTPRPDGPFLQLVRTFDLGAGIDNE